MQYACARNTWWGSTREAKQKFGEVIRFTYHKKDANTDTSEYDMVLNAP